MTGFVTIDNQKVEINGERNLLEMIRKTGIDLPTFCYHSELSIYGACRLCVVETDKGQVISSCSTPPADGMVIKTNTSRLMRIRKMMLELLLANHNHLGRCYRWSIADGLPREGFCIGSAHCSG